MRITAKQFANLLNKSLDDLGVSVNSRERAAILSKMIDISKQQAWSALEGKALPEDDLLEKIARDFEIEIDPK